MSQTSTSSVADEILRRARKLRGPSDPSKKRSLSAEVARRAAPRMILEGAGRAEPGQTRFRGDRPNRPNTGLLQHDPGNPFGIQGAAPAIPAPPPEGFSLPQRTFGGAFANAGAEVIPFVGAVPDAMESLADMMALHRIQIGEGTANDIARLGALQQRQIERQASTPDTVLGRAKAISGEILTQAPGFMVEFASGAGAMRAVGAGSQRAIRKAIGDLATTRAGRVSATAGGFVAGTTGVMPSRVVPLVDNVIDRMTPGVQLADPERAALRDFLVDDQDGFLEALAKAGGDEYIELFSERTGGLVAAPLAGLKGAILRRWVFLNPDAGLAGALNRAATKAGFHGIVGEVFEERVGEALRGITGIEEYHPPTPEQLLGEVMAFGAMGAIPGTVSAMQAPLQGISHLEKERQEREAFDRAAADHALELFSPDNAQLLQVSPRGQTQRPNDQIERSGPISETGRQTPESDRQESEGKVPQPFGTLVDGTPFYGSEEDANKVAAFRNQRRVPGEARVKVERIAGGGFVVRSPEPRPKRFPESASRHARQTADHAERTRQARLRQDEEGTLSGAAAELEQEAAIFRRTEAARRRRQKRSDAFRRFQERKKWAENLTRSQAFKEAKAREITVEPPVTKQKLIDALIEDEAAPPDQRRELLGLDSAQLREVAHKVGARDRGSPEAVTEAIQGKATEEEIDAAIEEVLDPTPDQPDVELKLVTDGSPLKVDAVSRLGGALRRLLGERGQDAGDMTAEEVVREVIEEEGNPLEAEFPQGIDATGWSALEVDQDMARLSGLSVGTVIVGAEAGQSTVTRPVRVFDSIRQATEWAEANPLAARAKRTLPEKSQKKGSARAEEADTPTEGEPDAVREGQSAGQVGTERDEALGEAPSGPPRSSRGKRKTSGSRGGPGAGSREGVRPAPGEREEPRGGRGTRDSDSPAPAPTAVRPGGEKSTGHNYRITPADQIGESFKPKERYRRNVEAIKLLKSIEAEDRRATPEEQAILVQYVGWGGLKQVFSTKGEGQKGWANEVREIRDLLTPEEYRDARRSVLNAHYTSPEVIGAMWQGLEEMGFQGGSIAEPAMGIGHFFGLMPSSIAAQSNRLLGVEFDGLTARIAQQLYQSADVRHQGFEATAIGEGAVDLFISNVPFGSIETSDAGSRELTNLRAPIHDFFFSKAIRKVRPGGLVVFITSRFSMDKVNGKFRKDWQQHADLVGMVRLPFTAFKGSSNTEVVTDIVVLQRRPEGAEPAGPAFTGTGQSPVKGNRINEYYLEHPEHVLGTQAATGTMHGDSQYNVEPDESRPLGEQIVQAFASMQANAAWLDATTDSSSETSERARTTLEQPARESSTQVKDGKVWIVENGELVEYPGFPTDPKGTYRKRVESLTAVRDAATAQVVLETSPTSTEEEVDAGRERLNKAYDAHASKYGPLHLEMNRRYFREDPDLGLMLALENNWDADAKTADKADIFEKRVSYPYQPITRVDSADAALTASLGERGRVDLAYMSEIAGKAEDALIEELGDAIYENPAGGWETKDQYLSGNVKEKLAAAEVAARSDRTFQRNVEALQDVIPEDLTPGEITVRLGASWIPEREYEDFAAFISGRRVGVNFNKREGSWTVEGSRGRRELNNKESETYGTPRRPALDLLQRLMNNAELQVYETGPSGTKHVNNEETAAARAKAKELQAAFREWIWENNDRAKRLADLYNTNFNNTVEWTPNGSHLTFPGMSEAWKQMLRSHQRNAAWRFASQGNSLFAHVVGAGKTASGIAGMMEAKRLGKVRKPVYVVPNHLVEQWARSVREIYPGARVLAPAKRDFEKSRRRRLLARIATNDWDAIIVPFSQFERMPMSEAYQRKRFEAMIAELEADIIEAKKEKQADQNFIAELEASKERLRNRLQKQSAAWKKDPGLSFEETGIDAILLDEAHEYKNLWFRTKMRRVPGVQPQEVQKTFDMDGKVQYLNERTQGHGVLFMTGTPIANSVTEMFTMMHYLAPGLLEQRGIDTFDAWANSFGEITSQVEVRPDGGGFRLHSRFNRFTNMPELQSIVRQFADVMLREDVDLPVPDIEGGGPKIIQSQRSPILAKIVESLVDRAAAISRGDVDPSEDNMLVVTGDGKKAALDVRLYDDRLQPDPDSKLFKCADNVRDIWEDTKKHKGVQIIWCDLSTPKQKQAPRAKQRRDNNETLQDTAESAFEQFDSTTDAQFSVYDEMKAMLVERGIPADEIVFIHDAKTDVARFKLFDELRRGKRRVIIASTPKLGTGANIQNRLVAAHHLDAPWKPAEIEQRDGRIIRQGNEIWDKHQLPIRIFRYVTEGSFDAYSWQTLESKAQFIADVMTGDLESRDVRGDLGKQSLEFGQMKAAASNNPKLMQFIEVQAQFDEIEAARRAHQSRQFQYGQELETIPTEIDRYEQENDRLTKDRDSLEGVDFSDEIGFEVDGRPVNNSDFAAYLETQIAKFILSKQTTSDVIGTVHGLKLRLRQHWRLTHLMVEGAGSMMIELGESKSGNITRIRNKLERGHQSEIDFNQSQIVQKNKRLTEVREVIGTDFQQEDEYNRLHQRFAQLQAEIEAEAKKGAPGTAPEGRASAEQPPGARSARRGTSRPTQFETFGDRLDAQLNQIIADARARIRSRQIPRGRSVGATTLGADLVDAAKILAARLMKGIVKFREWKKEMKTDFPGIEDDQIREVWDEGQRIAKMQRGEMDVPPTVEEVVQEQVEKAAPKAPQKRTTPIDRAVRETYRLAVQNLQAQTKVLLHKAKEAEKLKGKAQAQVLDGLRKQVRRMVEENLPPSVRGRFLPETTNVRTLRDVEKAVNKIRRESIRAQVGFIGSRLKAAGHPKNQRRLSQVVTTMDPDTGEQVPQRDFVRQKLAEARVILDQFKKRKGRTRPKDFDADAMEAALERLRELQHAILGVYAEVAFERKVLAVQGGMRRRKAVAVAVVETRPSKVRKSAMDVEYLDRRSTAGERVGNAYSTVMNLSAKVGGWNDDAVIHTMLYQEMARVHETYHSALRDVMDEIDAEARAAGFSSLNDARDQSARLGGSGRTVFLDVVLGGQHVRITLGNAMKIAATLGDFDTMAEIEAGKPIVLEGGRSREPLNVTRRELEQVLALLTPEQLGLVEKAKMIRERFRDDVFAAFRRIKGYEPEIMPGYEPRSIERNQREEKFTFAQLAAGAGTRWAQNLGFMKERTGGGEAVVIGDFLTDWVRSMEHSLNVIHIAEHVRDSAAILMNPDVKRAVTARYGKETYEALQDFLVAASLVNERISSPFGQFISIANELAAIKFLSLNPSTHLRQFGGVFRLAATMPPEAFAKGLAKFATVKIDDLRAKSGYFDQRYARSVSGRHTAVTAQEQERWRDLAHNLEAIAANVMVAINKKDWREARAALDRMRRVGATPLALLNAFDSVNAKIAWVGYSAIAEKELPNATEAERHAWVVEQSTQAVRETQNASSVLDMPLLAVRGRDSAIATMLLFTSDVLRARNRIIWAAHQGKKEFAKHVAAEAANIVWSVSAGYARFIVPAIVAAISGDDEDWKEMMTEILAIDRALMRFAREVVGLIDPIILSNVFDIVGDVWGEEFQQAVAEGVKPLSPEVAKRIEERKSPPGFAGKLIDAPFLAIFDDLQSAAEKLMRVWGKDERKASDVMLAFDAAIREILTLTGLNSFASIWRQASRQVERQMDTAERRDRRGQGPGSEAYFEFQDIVDDWIRENERENAADFRGHEPNTPLGDFRRAIREDDDEAAAEAARAYVAQGGSRDIRSLMAGLRVQHPLGRVRQKARFRQHLTPEQKELLKEATDYYRETLLPDEEQQKRLSRMLRSQ